MNHLPMIIALPGFGLARHDTGIGRVVSHAHCFACFFFLALAVGVSRTRFSRSGSWCGAPAGDVLVGGAVACAPHCTPRPARHGAEPNKDDGDGGTGGLRSRRLWPGRRAVASVGSLGGPAWSGAMCGGGMGGGGRGGGGSALARALRVGRAFGFGSFFILFLSSTSADRASHSPLRSACDSSASAKELGGVVGSSSRTSSGMSSSLLRLRWPM